MSYKNTEELSFMKLKVTQNLNKPWPCGFKNDMRNWVNFHYNTEMSEKLYFDGVKVLDEKVQIYYASWHWRVIESLKKNWLLIQKMTWGIWWILMQAVKFAKSALWCATFVESILCLSQKSTEELCVITLKNDANM